VHHSFDDVSDLGRSLDQTHRQSLQLLGIQLSQERWQSGTLVDLHWVMNTGQQRRDDMFAPATPVIGTRTESLDDAPGISGDLHPVWLVLTTLYLGLDLPATASNVRHGALRIVLTATLVRVSRGVLTDDGIG